MLHRQLFDTSRKGDGQQEEGKPKQGLGMGSMLIHG
jgi:hypothetical protein